MGVEHSSSDIVELDSFYTGIHDHQLQGGLSIPLIDGQGYHQLQVFCLGVLQFQMALTKSHHIKAGIAF